MDLEDFIGKWSAARGGAERANYQMFLGELCQAIGVPSPDPAGHDTALNDYVFERGVKRRDSEGLASTLRIDLYKRGCFILEAKQSRAEHRDEHQQALFREDETRSVAASQGKWDVLMRNARRQAEDYVFRLPPDHPAPPFIIVCDVGYVFEIYADFSGSGRAYTHFPDRKSFRIRLEDLRDEKVRDRLVAIWTDPQALDPSREAARVTREIAKRLAEVSKTLEARHPPEEVAHFLMRCIFTMFAEDVDLLPKGQFTALLEDCLDGPATFAPLLEELWRKMDAPDHKDRFYSLFKAHLRHFNGSLFKDARAFPMGREEIGELLAASKHDWRYVEPAIFGTLVEQALDPSERRKLGAHYTPRSYVERLVQVTVMEPLRQDWADVQLRVTDARGRGEAKEAVAAVRAFHHQLCTTRVLDPACGTGNFLYVSLELMKKLEGEVLEALAELGETEGIGLEEVDPHQFLGIELNVRAAAIAELVLWIGYLQQHYRNRTEHPAEPILKAFGNIQQKDAVLTWDGYPEPRFQITPPPSGEGDQPKAGGGGGPAPVYPNARRPDWPDAEFIVGNPPFIGGKDLRSRMDPGYAEALWSAHKHMNESADFVMYWWDRAAELLTRKKTPLRRFGLVTTNSISQVFQRRVMERHLNAKAPVSIIFAVPDHPWTKATTDSASVRIAIAVVRAGSHDGMLREVIAEAHLDTDAPTLELSRDEGRINSDLTLGIDTTKVASLTANQGLCSRGMTLAGSGFLLSKNEAALIGYWQEGHPLPPIKRFEGGRDLTQKSRNLLVIDTYGISEVELRKQHPLLWQRLYETVRQQRAAQFSKSPTADARAYAESWWQFAKARQEFRPGLTSIDRYIVTPRTARHRTFQFLSTASLVESEVVAIAVGNAEWLAIMSAHPHVLWATRVGGWLGVGNDPRYTKTTTFDPFPFPDPDEAARATLRALGEELDATRKTIQAEHPDLTLTGLYNVLEKVRAGADLTDAEADVKDRGRVLILKDLHDQIDRATADAYGWPHDLTDEQILEKLVALNAERAKEEAAGHVRWLRPDYQIPRFAKTAAAKSGELDLGGAVVAIDKALPPFPKDKGEQVMAIRAVLQASGRPMDAAAVSRAFKNGGRKIEQRVVQALATLVRYGDATPLPAGTFAARRAA